jgi:S1-C subfamily serine protease
MPGSIIVCPQCGAKARSSRQLAVGTRVKCPTCSHVFTWDEPVEQDLVVEPVEPDDSPSDSGRQPSSRPAASKSGPPRRIGSEKVTKSRKKKVSIVPWLGLMFAIFLVDGVLGVALGILAHKLFIYEDKKPRNNLPAPQRLPFGDKGGDRPLLFARAGDQPRFGEPFDATALTQPNDDDLRDEEFGGVATAIFSDPLIPAGPPQPLIAPKAPARGGKGVGPEAGVAMAPAVIERVKRATTMVRVTRSDGRDGTGSGFFVAPRLVMTNAHVLGMLEPRAAAPRRIELVLNSGSANEAKYPGEVVVVDRGNDLALVKVTGDEKSLPEPLPVVDGSNLIETQPVFVFGFPLGDTLGKAITVAESRVSSLRRDQHGVLDRIQVNGGMHPGNSGGPVVDVGGNVVGVAVSVIRDTAINFAVSGERVNSLLAGRIDSLVMGEPEAFGDRIKWVLKAVAKDPLRQIKSVSVVWWWGNANESYPPSRGKIEQPTESQTSPLTAQSPEEYVGTLTLPQNFPPSKVLWLQVRQIDAEGELAYRACLADVYTLPKPKSVRLEYRPRRGKHRLALVSNSNVRLRSFDGDSHVLRIRADVTAEEDRLGLDQAQGWVFGLQIQKIDVNIRADDQVPRDLSIQDHVEHLPKIRIELRTDSRGRVTGGRTASNDIPDEARRVLASFVDETARTLEFLSFACPDQVLSPHTTWTDQRELALLGAPSDIKVRMQVTYKYRGVVRWQGRDFAFVEIAGKVDQNPLSPQIEGKVEGRIFVDLRTGMVANGTVRLISSPKLDDDSDLDNDDSVTDVEIRIRRQ